MTPRVDVDGRSIGYGDGGVAWREGLGTVVLVHGAALDHSVWALQARALAQHGWNVAAPDLPGHGRSEDAEGTDSIEGYAGWLERFIVALGASEVALVGHSMGACIALTLAATVPQRVRALALLGSGPTLNVNDSLLHDTTNDPQQATRFITAFGHAQEAHFGGSEAPGVWMLGAGMALLERCDPHVLERDFHACNAWEGEALAPSVEAPTLVLSGAGDRMTPPGAGRALAESIPNGEFEILPNVGHMMMSESPGKVTRSLRSFFDRLI